MSKSLGNVVDPRRNNQEIRSGHGAPLHPLRRAAREGPRLVQSAASKARTDSSAAVWRLVEGSLDQLKAASPERVAMKDITLKEERDMKRVIHSTLDRVTKDIRDERQFNTAVARLMELANALIAYAPRRRKRAGASSARASKRCSAASRPFAPHITEEPLAYARQRQLPLRPQVVRG